GITSLRGKCSTGQPSYKVFILSYNRLLGNQAGAAEAGFFRRAAEGNRAKRHFSGKGWWVMIRAGSRQSIRGLSLLVAALTALMASNARADLFVSSQSYNLVGQYDENTGDFLN